MNQKLKNILAIILLPVLTAGSAYAGDHKNAACGQVILDGVAPVTKDVYPVNLNSIDGETVVNTVDRFALSPGKHTLRVIEKIDAPELSRRNRQGEERVKYLDIEIEADKLYYLGAQFNRTKRSKIQSGEYWDATVWRVSDGKCDADAVF